ncbi:FdrA protein [Antricoccus suffuscus]|uniref:FdrA protein n=1 Tax=Antricoccus suffuscus TaxID=1629062 RepID=A0A2T0ZVK5_9ACTN|nr:FdrA family protein [Antricoccus suffuscus]PRZ40379.1 FdrA protein [Antricoccus suffuscus]
MSEHVEIRSGVYRDSVALLQVSKHVAAVAGVEAAIIAMATELNLDLARQMGFTGLDAAEPADLLIAIRCGDDVLETALTEMEGAMASSPSVAASSLEVPAHTVGAALRRADEATLVLLSVPGAHVLPEALDALEAGRSVMIFSDNVPIAHEVLLKELAAQRGLLVMGPDCGTAIVGGVALGFANVVRRGDVGIVAASGTGAQQLACLLDHAGIGISQLIGVGGRDLRAEVAGRSTIQALSALDADPGTTDIIVVSKPAPAEVTHAVRAVAERLSTRVTFCVLGPGQPTMSDTVSSLVQSRHGTSPKWPAVGVREQQPRAGRLSGIYSGGTLADEAMVIASSRLGEVRSNIPLSPGLLIGPNERASTHVVIDYGDDELTRGRPHPMIDPSIRLERIAMDAADPSCAVILLDVVLGHVADPDPAATLAPALRAAGKPVIVSLIGTEADPQHWSRTAEALADAGAEVYLSNAQATARAVDLVAEGTVA